jgi:hypothetical protein
MQKKIYKELLIHYKNMTSSKDNKEENFNLSEDLRNNYSIPNNSFENNNSKKENKADNSRPSSYPSIHPSTNNPPNENDILDDSPLYQSPNFDLSIDLNRNNSQIGNYILDDDRLSNSLSFVRSFELNLNNSQNEDFKPKNNLIIHSSISQNAIIPLNENDNFVYARPSDGFNFHSLSYLNVNNSLNENGRIMDSLKFHQSIGSLNVNNSQIEKDSIENGGLNEGFNSGPLIDNINVNNPQFENDKIKRTKVLKTKRQIFTISKIKKRLKRNDYIKKFFKTSFNKFLKKLANKIIKKSKLPKKFKQKKIYTPSRLSFTAITSKSDNCKFLSFTIKKVLTYYKKENCKNKNKYQKKNKENIEEILKFINESKDESVYEEIKFFFNMTLEEAYELFYQDAEFKKFQEDKKVIEIDDEVKVINRVSLREKNGFIQLVKSHLKEN